MRKDTITLALLTEDAEPILRRAAYEAARYSALLDYVPRRCWHSPHRSGINFEDQQAEWRTSFLKAKRMVEAFGVDYEPTSENETVQSLYAEIQKTKGTSSALGMTFRHVETIGWSPKKLECHYRGEVHSQACHAAAERTVRCWREAITSAKTA